MRRIEALNQFALQLVAGYNWTNVYGIARSLLAIGTLITLLFTDIHVLLQPVNIPNEVPKFLNFPKISLFYLLDFNFQLAKWIAVSILLIVASGWRPRITGILHWWVSYSFIASAILVDGGDHITSVLTLLLIPICLVDSRKWHWTLHTPAPKTENAKWVVANLIAITSFFIIRLQVAFIYFHAGVGKLEVEEWVNGTATYYWFTEPMFGLSSWLAPIITPLLVSPWGVCFITWGVIVFEILLFLGLTLHSKWRSTLLILGIAFHFGIVLIHGLVSFFFAMSAALLLYLRPKTDHITFLGFKKLKMVSAKN